MSRISLFWFRRDLRLTDNHGLFLALSRSEQVIPVFVFDPAILDRLTEKKDRRVQLIFDALRELNSDLASRNGSRILMLKGSPEHLIPELAIQTGASAVYTNTDYEPAAIHRDTAVQEQLMKSGIGFHPVRDHVIFHQNEIVKEDGKPYVVYTPYSKAWKSRLTANETRHFASESLLEKVIPANPHPSEIQTLSDIGFSPADVSIQGTRQAGLQFLSGFSARMASYGETRDFPAVKGVSYLSPYLRFGMIGIRECVRLALSENSSGSAKWLNELIWRDFYSQILWHFPQVVSDSFKPEYAGLQFPNDEEKFRRWCEGTTGFPIVDAAMRQLNQTGWMHNRLRMVAASFLVKDLHVDWRWGEQYFAEKLLDFDLASNNGGWQWAASTGCDAQPYFRIFNPELQSRKFDPAGKFIRKYCPELKNLPDSLIHSPATLSEADQILYGCRIGTDYPVPVVLHPEAKEKALLLYRKK